MIMIKQDSQVDRAKLPGLLDKFGNTPIKLDLQLIQDDVIKLDTIYGEKATSKLRRENINRTKRYLASLARHSEKPIELKWALRGNEILSAPIEVRKIPQFGIQTTDYITLDSGNKLLSYNFSKVLDIIAFEITHRDFGFSTEAVEKELSHISSVMAYSCDELNSLMEWSEYRYSITMMIGDSPYMSADKKTVRDYFGNPLDTDKYYRSVIESSREIAVDIIVQNLLGRAQQKRLQVYLAGVYEDSIYFIVPDSVAEVATQDFMESVVIRAFGRKFEVPPRIQLY